jgi:hypothetical protein
MQHRLIGLRGKAYVAEYKRILNKERGEILAIFEEIVAANDGKFSAKSLGQLASRIRMPLTWIDDCLPEITNYRYPSHTWDRLKDRGVKAKDIGVVWE